MTRVSVGPTTRVTLCAVYDNKGTRVQVRPLTRVTFVSDGHGIGLGTAPGLCGSRADVAALPMNGPHRRGQDPASRFDPSIHRSPDTAPATTPAGGGPPASSERRISAARSGPDPAASDPAPVTAAARLATAWRSSGP